MTNDSQQTPAPPELGAASGSALAAGPWHKGPANGGQGTAGERNGVAQWWDGDLLLIVVETNSGRDIAAVRISCDVHFFSVTDVSTGDEYSDWMPDQWAWWARISEPPPSEQNVRMSDGL
jgi:hypothetical protein